MKLRSTLILFLLVGLLAGFGCSAREDGVATPTAGATASSTPTIEDATPTPAATARPTVPGIQGPLPAGLQKVLADVATVRHLSAPPALKAELIARSALPELLESLITDEDRRQFAETTTLYRLLGHFRDDQDYLTLYQSFGADSILGLYSPLDDQLWVVYPDGQQPDFDNLPRDQAQTLAHELAHAIQDYHFKLDVVYDDVIDDLDRLQVFTSVVEGDAVDTEGRYSDEYLAAPYAGRLFALAVVPQVVDAPPTFIRELYFPYTTGANWISQLRREQGDSYIDELLADPPAATAYVLHPDLLRSGWEPVLVSLPDLASAIGAGWERESGGTLGEFHLGNYLQLQLGLGDASAAATGWAGDHYDVYVNGGESAAVFQVMFRNEAEAQEFVELHELFIERAGGVLKPGDGFAFGELATGKAVAVGATQGDSVSFAYGSSGEVVEQAMRALQDR
jgi:hypothetical protein